MPSPKFATKKEWFDWYSNVYLQCYHWRDFIRPLVFEYRHGICYGCGQRISGTYQCHHGEGMYQHLGEEQYYLDRMFVMHPKCHEKLTNTGRRKKTVKKIRRFIIGF